VPGRAAFISTISVVLVDIGWPSAGVSFVLKMRLSFLDCTVGVSGVFFVAAVVSDSADDIFGTVATGQSAFCISPVAFRLALMVSGIRPQEIYSYVEGSV